MRVRLLVERATLAGPERIGQVVDVSTEEAARMIEEGQATPCREKPAEYAIHKPEPERATRKKKRRS